MIDFTNYDLAEYYEAEHESAYVREIEWQSRDESLSYLATPKQVRCPKCKDVFDGMTALNIHFQPCLKNGRIGK